jgi:hypothetical protein
VDTVDRLLDTVRGTSLRRNRGGLEVGAGLLGTDEDEEIWDGVGIMT